MPLQEKQENTITIWTTTTWTLLANDATPAPAAVDRRDVEVTATITSTHYVKGSYSTCTSVVLVPSTTSAGANRTGSVATSSKLSPAFLPAALVASFLLELLDWKTAVILAWAAILDGHSSTIKHSTCIPPLNIPGKSC